MQQDPDPNVSARDKLIQLLGVRDHSRSELERKLRQRGFPASAIEGALSWAGEQGYLDERRFAAAFTGELERKGFGPRAIQKKLYEKGVRASNEPGEAPEPASDAELEARARELCVRRFGEPADLDPPKKLRAARFLATRGYGFGTIRAVLGPLPRS